ncbi:Ionotropic receptor 452 [Blattella germanica]|nr:Ionotropic receptor 452 [Blattella germanica]
MNMAFYGRLCLIILFLLFVKDGTNRLPLDSVSPVEDSLSQCIAKIANEYFNRDLPTALFIPYREYESQSYISNNNSHVDFLVQSLHQRIDNSLVMLDYHNNPETLLRKVKLGSYILILSGEVSLYFDLGFEVIWKIYEVAGHMSPSGRLLIATTGSPDKERIILIPKLLQVIWDVLEISEAILLLPRIRSNNDDVIEVYKWLPEDQDDPCFLLLNRFVVLDIWIMKVNEFIAGTTLFENKLITDMKNCKLNLTLRHYPPFVAMNDRYMLGPLVDLLFILFHTLKIRLYLNQPGVEQVANFELPVGVTNVTNKELDINQECVAIYPYFIQHLKWVVPAGAPVPRWKSLIKIFNPLMWLCVVTTFIIGSTTSWLLLNQSQQSLTYISALLDTLLTYVVVGISDRYKGTVATTFFLLWLFYCLIINTAYQSALISFLNDPGQEQPIKTIEELHKSGLHLMSMIFNAFVVESENIEETSHFDECSFMIPCLKLIAQNGDTALLDDEVLLRLVVNKYFDTETNRHLLHTIEENAYTFYFTIAVYSHGCLIFKRMEQLMHRMWSAGLIIKYLNGFNEVQRIIYYGVLNDDPFVITLSHLQGAFYFLTCGLFVSIIVFLIEISYWSVLV